jgi:hypothetical protein
MNGHIAKPVDRRTLLAAVKSRAINRASTAEAPPSEDLPELLSVMVLDDLEAAIGRDEVIRLARSVLARLDAAMEQFRRDAADHRFDRVGALAHKLISASGYLGLMRLSRQFGRLQDMAAEAREGQPIDLLPALDRIRNALAASVLLLLDRLPECAREEGDVRCRYG